MMTVAATSLVTASDIHAGYGPLQVLKGIDLEIGQSEFLGVIGHNGAGKSTLLKVLGGFLKPTRGDVVRIAATGEKFRVGLVPQGLAVFPRMSVEHNLRIPELAGQGGDHLVPVDEIVDMFPILGQRFSQAAGNLSGGEQRMLSVGMALRLSPHLLLLDEPSLGLAPFVVTKLMEVVDEMRRRLGYTVVVVEQNLDVLLRRADRLVAVRQGEIVWQGSPTEVDDVRVLWRHY